MHKCEIIFYFIVNFSEIICVQSTNERDSTQISIVISPSENRLMMCIVQLSLYDA